MNKSILATKISFAALIAAAVLFATPVSAQTRQIALGITHLAAITSADPAQRYAFALPLLGRLSVQVSTDGSASALPHQGSSIKLFAPNGELIRTAPSGFTFPFNDTVDITSAGVYHIEVAGEYTGTYSILVVCNVVEGGPSNTDANALPMPLGYTVSGTITPTDTADVYRYVLTQSGRLTVDVTRGTMPASSLLIRWRDSSGTQIGASNALGVSSYNGFMDLEAGVYYVAIVRRAGNNTGTYTMSATFTAAGNNEQESNNSRETAQRLISGQTVTGFISHQDSTDMYRYVAAEPGRLTVNAVRGSMTGSSLILRWFNADSVLISSTVSVETYSKDMDLEAGTYYISIVRREGNFSGTYKLSVDFTAAGNNEAEPNSVRPEAQLLTSGQTVKGFISDNDVSDMYRYVLTEPGNVRVDVSRGTMPASGLIVQWLDADGVQIAGSNNVSLYQHNMDLGSGTYYISIVRRTVDYTGTYFLTAVTGTPAPPVSITGVTVYPASASIPRGFTHAFTATATGIRAELSQQGVAWAVTGGVSAATAISADGVLTIAEDETAAMLTVTAVSTSNASVSGSADISVLFPHTYTVSFDANGGTVTPETGVTDGNGLGRLLFLPAPIMTGYVFGGWFTEKVGGAEVTASMEFNADATIYARWTPVANAAVPHITRHPASGAVTLGETHTFTVSAVVYDNGTLSYQWYRNTFAGNVGGAPISGATEASYTPSAAASGTFYYYAVATNTNEHAAGNKTAATASAAAGVLVKSEDEARDSSVIFIEDFEGGTHSFTLANGSVYNKWHVGTAVAGGGNRSAYISDNNGTSNRYSTSNQSWVHMYRDVTFPESYEPYALTFIWRALGQDNADYMQVHLVETSVTPTGGSFDFLYTETGNTNLGSYSGSNLWQSARVEIPGMNSGTKKRLVFSWRNDASSGSQPPAAVDNISITAYRYSTPRTVTFDLNGGTGVAPESITGITSGSALPEELSPPTSGITKTGFRNDGRWYIDREGVTEFVFGTAGTPVMSDWTLYPKWVQTTSIATPDRDIPQAGQGKDAAVVIPVNPTGFEFTAGPNPVSKSTGEVGFFVSGTRISSGRLTIYDAAGNAVRKITVNDRLNSNSPIVNRQVATWDLRNNHGHLVASGTYLARGTVKTVGGKREKVSVVIGVR